jgi:hypothetical protein
MTPCSLEIHTYGVCTHFAHGVVSGVPHRVVLPNAATVRYGRAALTDDAVHRGEEVLYYLMPHFARLESSGPAHPWLAGLIENGWIRERVRLQVINCVESTVHYHRDDSTPRLTAYVPDYSYSGDVVFHGRAACYFDVYGGKVHGVGPKDGKAGWVTISMQTNGPPQLLVTPLGPASLPVPTPVASHTLSLENGDGASEYTLALKNLELKCEDDLCVDEARGAYDFLLHYLTARGGIPRNLTKPTPGMPDVLPIVTRERLALALADLAILLLCSGPASDRECMDPGDLTPSCSPSQYP